MSHPTKFGIVIVKNPSGGENLKLMFTRGSVMWDTIQKLKDEGFEIVDDYFGYKLYQNADDAVQSAKTFCR